MWPLWRIEIVSPPFLWLNLTQSFHTHKNARNFSLEDGQRQSVLIIQHFHQEMAKLPKWKGHFIKNTFNIHQLCLLCPWIPTAAASLPEIQPWPSHIPAQHYTYCCATIHTFTAHRQQIASLIPHHALPSVSATCETNCAGNFTTNYPVSAKSPESRANQNPGSPCPHTKTWPSLMLKSCRLYFCL